MMQVNIKGRGEVLETFQVTSRFGSWEPFRDHAHLGQDFAMRAGQELHPLMDGVITKIVDQGSEGLGKGIYVQMDNGDTAIYGHLSEFGEFKVGDHVDPSDVIGLSGSTGESTGGHLHLGIKDSSGAFQDPSQYESIVQSWDAAAPVDLVPHVPDPFEIGMRAVEKARDGITDKGTELTHDAVIWILDALKDAGIYLGKWMILIGPDTAVILSMIFCIGAICSIPKTGKWSVSAIITGVILEIFRKVLMIG